MSLCQPCYSLFSRRKISSYEKHKLHSTAPDLTVPLEKSNAIKACPFCTFLRLLFPDEEYTERREGTQGGSTIAKRGLEVDLECELDFQETRDISLEGTVTILYIGSVCKIGHEGQRFELLFVPKSRAYFV
jgi:hypothetical protein